MDIRISQNYDQQLQKDQQTVQQNVLQSLYQNQLEKKMTDQFFENSKLPTEPEIYKQIQQQENHQSNHDPSANHASIQLHDQTATKNHANQTQINGEYQSIGLSVYLEHEIIQSHQNLHTIMKEDKNQFFEQFLNEKLQQGQNLTRSIFDKSKQVENHNQPQQSNKLRSPSFFSTEESANNENVDYNIMDSMDLQIPTAGCVKQQQNLNQSTGQNALTSNISGQFCGEVRYIRGYHIEQNHKSVKFICSDNKEIIKNMSQFYLQSLQEYFYYSFSILLPKHIPKILDFPSSELYLQIYFDFIIQNYSQKLLVFLQNYTPREQLNSPRQIGRQPIARIKQIGNQLGHMMLNKLVKVMDLMQNTIKRFRGQNLSKTRLLQKLLYQQIEMEYRHKKARQKIQSLTNIKIHQNAFQLGDRNRKLYALMCFNWLIGFQLRQQMILQKMKTSSNEIQKGVLNSQLITFKCVQEKQKAQKMKFIQKMLHEGIYTNSQ